MARYCYVYLREVTGAGAPTITDDVTVETMGGIRTLQDSGQLRVPNAGLLSIIENNFIILHGMNHFRLDYALEMSTTTRS